MHKYFRNHHKPAAWLSERPGSLKPQLPGDTRWKSHLTCIDTFLTNKAHYATIIIEHAEDLHYQLRSHHREQDPGHELTPSMQGPRKSATATPCCQCHRPNTERHMFSGLTPCAVWLSLLCRPGSMRRCNTSRRLRRTGNPTLWFTCIFRRIFSSFGYIHSRVGCCYRLLRGSKAGSEHLPPFSSH